MLLCPGVRVRCAGIAWYEEVAGVLPRGVALRVGRELRTPDR